VLARLRAFELSIWMSASVAVVMAPAFARLRAEHLPNKLPGFSPRIDGGNTLCSKARDGSDVRWECWVCEPDIALPRKTDGGLSRSDKFISASTVNSRHDMNLSEYALRSHVSLTPLNQRFYHPLFTFRELFRQWRSDILKAWRSPHRDAR
jgi:hypothetical protein